MKSKKLSKKFNLNFFIIFIFILVSISLVSNSADAKRKFMKKVNGYPNKPITYVVAYGFGGGGDTFTRTLSVPLGKVIGVPINVINVSGGAYANAITYMMNQPADGYTVLTTGTAIMIGDNLKRLPVDLFENFVLLPQIAGEEAQLYVKGDSSIKTFKDLLKYGKEHSTTGKLKFGGSDAGGSRELDVRQILKVTGMTGIYVPFTKGSAMMQAELLAGRLDVAYDLEGPMKNLLTSKDARMLVTSGDKRKPNYPDVPKFAEYGFKELNLTVSRGAIVRKGTPKERVEFLSEALKRTMNTAAFKASAKVLGLDLVYRSGAEYTEAMKKKKKEYYQIQKELGWIK